MQTTTGKSRRHREILAILAKNEIGSQDDLSQALKARKVSVTQSTLSRDLKELQITRVASGGSYRYVPPGSEGGSSPVAGLNEKLREIASLVVAGVESNDSVVAIKTLPGRAPGLASFLDGLDLQFLMATVAGDDTVITYPRRTSQTRKLERRLRELLDV